MSRDDALRDGQTEASPVASIGLAGGRTARAHELLKNTRQDIRVDAGALMEEASERLTRYFRRKRGKPE